MAEPCFTLFFEVLDNLPHDKVIWSEALNKYDCFVTVDLDSNLEAKEFIEKDPLVKECLEIYLKAAASRSQEEKPFLDKIAGFFVERMMKKSHKECKDLFLPTYLLRLMKRIKANIPQGHLVISDFDQLITNVEGINAPIVSKKGFKS